MTKIDEFVPLSVEDYSRSALATDLRRDAASLNFALLGLFGEVGSLLAEVKKKQRDPIAYRAYAAAVTEELGDVLWYLNLAAARGGLSLGEIVKKLQQDGKVLQEMTDEPITFQELQPPILTTLQTPSPAFEATLIELAAQTGLLMADQRDELLHGDPQLLGSRLAAVLEILIRAASEAGVTLEAAVVKNRLKTTDRWPINRTYPVLFDADAPPEEQLPRSLRIQIFERDVGGKRYVFQTCNGINIGDRLTDNAMAPDDYRFHDVFHYAYVAILGWSPVTRSLFRLKRKSMPIIDEVQDGARAKLIEEGVATWIFGQAVEMDFFRELKSGELPFYILKQVRQFVSGYEAEHCPTWLWEEAILQGYAAFRYLRENRRGTIVLDVEGRQLRIETLP
jgi:NTP pyrophosphatase (non-canonical NTP hydrolase)